VVRRSWIRPPRWMNEHTYKDLSSPFEMDISITINSLITNTLINHTLSRSLPRLIRSTTPTIKMQFITLAFAAVAVATPMVADRRDSPESYGSSESAPSYGESSESACTCGESSSAPWHGASSSSAPWHGASSSSAPWGLSACRKGEVEEILWGTRRIDSR
jgi:hypothetical protein